MPALLGSAVLTVFIGLILSSATSSIIVFAQELMPHRFGMISGVFFGVAFGIGGLGAAVLGKLADHTGIAFVYHLCAFLPALGLLAVFLPKMPKHRCARARARRRCSQHQQNLNDAMASCFFQYIVRTCGGFRHSSLLRMHHSRREPSARDNSQRLSTLIIRVKRRLNICWHRPPVSFEVRPLDQPHRTKDEANA